MNGIALAVLISQLPKLFGFSIESMGPMRDLWAILMGVLDGKANWAGAALGAGTLAVIFLLQGNKRIPGVLIAVVGATIVAASSTWTNLSRSLSRVSLRIVLSVIVALYDLSRLRGSARLTHMTGKGDRQAADF